MVLSAPPELAPLGPAYAELYERIAAELAPRVRALRLGSGSLLHGTADAYSDLDLVAEVDDPGSFDAVEALRAATPTVLLRRMPFGAVAITPEWLRVDLVVAGPGGDGGPPEAPPTDVDGLGEEFLRVLGLLPIVVGRGEWIVASDGAWLLRSFLVRLLLAENGERAVTGAKRLNEKLTAGQRALVESLPPIAATRDAVIAAHLAIADAFLPRARPLAVNWPAELEAATRAYLVREGVCPG
jgi:hypothetical protein